MSKKEPIILMTGGLGALALDTARRIAEKIEREGHLVVQAANREELNKARRELQAICPPNHDVLLDIENGAVRSEFVPSVSRAEPDLSKGISESIYEITANKGGWAVEVYRGNWHVWSHNGEPVMRMKSVRAQQPDRSSKQPYHYAYQSVDGHGAIGQSLGKLGELMRTDDINVAFRFALRIVKQRDQLAKFREKIRRQ